jgi:hypothetical protein
MYDTSHNGTVSKAELTTLLNHSELFVFSKIEPFQFLKLYSMLYIDRMKAELTIMTTVQFTLEFRIQRRIPVQQVLPNILVADRIPDPHTPLTEGQSSPIPDYMEDYEEEVDAYTNHDLVEKAFEVRYLLPLSEMITTGM